MIDQIEETPQGKILPAALMAFAESKTRILQLLRSPSTFFAESRNGEHTFIQAIKDSMLLWMTITVVLFCVTVLNLNAIKTSNLAFSSLTGTPPHANAYLPWSQLGFPLFWSVVPLIVGAIRHLFLVVLGERDRSLQKTLAIALYAALPFSLATGLSSILAAAIPCMPRPNSGMLSCPSLLIGSLLIIAGGCTDIYVWIKGLKMVYRQNTGRAILTYISPLILFMLSSFAVYMITTILFAFTRSQG